MVIWNNVGMNIASGRHGSRGVIHVCMPCHTSCTCIAMRDCDNGGVVDCAGWGGAVLKEQFLLTPKLDPTALGIVQISRETFSQSEGNDRFLPEVLSDGSEVHVYSRNHSDPIVAVDSDRDTTYAFPRGSVLKVRLSDQPCWWMVA